MFWGSATPAPFPSTPNSAHEPGRNCIGPTARAHRPTPTPRPFPVAAIAAVPAEPSNTGPRIGGTATPAGVTRPPSAWFDSTFPIPASSGHGS